MLMKLRAKLKSQKGFTLIELLVVIAIIGVLAAVAVPRFMDSTAGARTAKVQGDLAAIDTASQLWSANNGGAIATTVQATTLLANGVLPTAPVGIYMINGTKTAASITPGNYTVDGNGYAQIVLGASGTFHSTNLKTNLK